MHPRSLLFVGLVGATLGFAPAPVFRESDRTPEVALKRLQGTWAMPRYEQGGRSMIPAGAAYTVAIEKDQWTFYFSRPGDPPRKGLTYTLKLDPKAAPAEIDLVRDKPHLVLGTYELEGDTLKIVWRSTNDTKRERARDFSNPAPRDEVLHLERIKP